MLLVRETELNGYNFRLRHVSTLLSSISRVMKSLLDIPLKVLIANKYTYIAESLLSFVVGGFLAFELSAVSIFFGHFRPT